MTGSFGYMLFFSIRIVIIGEAIDSRYTVPIPEKALAEVGTDKSGCTRH